MNYELILGYLAISRFADERQPQRRPRTTFERRSRQTRRRLAPVLRAALTGVSRKESER